MRRPLIALALILAFGLAVAPPGDPPPWEPGQVGVCPCGRPVVITHARVEQTWGNQALRVADPGRPGRPSGWIPASAIGRLAAEKAPAPGRLP